MKALTTRKFCVYTHVNSGHLEDSHPSLDLTCTTPALRIVRALLSVFDLPSLFHMHSPLTFQRTNMTVKKKRNSTVKHWHITKSWIDNEYKRSALYLPDHQNWDLKKIFTPPIKTIPLTKTRYLFRNIF